MATGQNGPGAEAVRTGHEAFNRRDRDALLACFAEDITWHGPLAGTLQGRDAVWEQFFTPMWEAPVRVEDHDLLDNGEHVVAVGEVVFDLPNGSRSWKVVEVGHYNQAGELTDRWALLEGESEFNEFVQQMA